MLVQQVEVSLPKTIRFDYWEEVSPRGNKVRIYEEGRFHYRVDRSP